MSIASTVLACRTVGQTMQHEAEVKRRIQPPDRRWVVTTSKDYTARLWERPSGCAAPLLQSAWSNGFNPAADDFKRFEFGVPRLRTATTLFWAHPLRRAVVSSRSRVPAVSSTAHA